MRFSAVFESWHIGDGNYPPLRKGQLVNLSFECQPRVLEVAAANAATTLEHRGNAEYRFCARVLRNYSDVDSSPLAILDTGSLRFYINGEDVRGLAPGSLVDGVGTLLLDHYIWVEFIDRYPDPPDLFYALRVSLIRKVRIPDRFVHRHERGKSHPTRVDASEMDPGSVVELETMEGQSFDEEFYIVEFDTVDSQRVERTFR